MGREDYISLVLNMVRIWICGDGENDILSGEKSKFRKNKLCLGNVNLFNIYLE